MLDGVGGLRPERWILIGAGYSREDIKAALLGRGVPLISDAVSSLPELAQRLVGVQADRVLGPSARQEALRMLFSERRITGKFVELKRLRRQVNFFQKLDRALQAGRMVFGHEEEEGVLLSYLTERFGANILQTEVRQLAAAWEGFLDALQCWDQARLLRRACEVLEEQGWPTGLSKPKEISVFSIQKSEGLEARFLALVGQQVGLRFEEVLNPRDTGESAPQPEWGLERWHTLDDAAEALGERWCERKKGFQGVVLIPDVPEVRRTLLRVLRDRGLFPADPRDPTLVRMEEGVKLALLPLDLVARDFEVRRVISWIRALRAKEGMAALIPRWIALIAERGIRERLESYRGGELEPLFQELAALKQRFAGKCTVAELAEKHMQYLQEQKTPADIIAILRATWDQYCRDLELLGTESRVAPLLFSLERLRSRLGEAAPPAPRTRAADGVRIYRLGQAAPSHEVFDDVVLFGLPSGWLEPSGQGDYWFNGRDREALELEFAVRGSKKIREERLLILKSWFSRTRRVAVLDADYGVDGGERESLLPVLTEAGQEFGFLLPAPTICGAHPRWVRSFDALRPVPPQDARVPAQETKISATALDRYSRCPFQALALSRWKLWDQRESEIELWPEVRGNILHAAVRELLLSRDDKGVPQLSAREAISKAWLTVGPKGLMRGERIENYVKTRLLQVVSAFLEKEREYQERAGTRTIAMDDQEFRWEKDGITLVGKPDRIEEHEDGLLIADYKSTSGLPTGTEMVETGYRLQLPFYALAAGQTLHKRVLGLQFIELSRKATRSSGIFFKAYNGKEKGKLSQLRSNSKSLFDMPPEDLWPVLENHVTACAASYAAGSFPVKPKRKDKDCRTCTARDLCGIRRVASDGS